MTTILTYFLLFSFWIEKALNFSLTHIKGLSLSNLAVYFLLFVWAIRVAVQKKKFFEYCNVNKYLILMILVAFISMFLKLSYHEIPNISLKSELVSLKDWADPYIVFFILYNIIDDEKTCKNILFGLIVFLFVTAISTPLISLGIFKFVKTYNFYQGRAGGFTEPNQYASYLVLFIPLAITYFIFSKNLILKYASGILVVVSFVALITTGSRGGFVAFVLSLGVYLLFLKREGILRFRGTVMVCIVVFFIGSISFALAPSQVKETVLKRFNPAEKETLNEITEAHGRLLLWQSGWQIYLEKPILGHGQKTFLSLIYKRFGIIGAPHNDYLKHMIEFGAIGLFVFIMILTKIVQHVWKHFKTTSYPWRKILYASYIAGFLGYIFSMLAVDLAAPRILFWIYTATIYAYTKLDKV